MRYIIAFLLLLLSTPAYAGSISAMTSGTLSDGNSVSFSGSGFGTKSTAAPIRFDDFDSGSGDVGSEGYWSVDGTSPTYNADNLRIAGKNVKAIMTGLQDVFYKPNLSINKGYTSFWVKYGYAGSSQLKTWRISGGTNDITYPGIFLFQDNTWIRYQLTRPGPTGSDSGGSTQVWSVPALPTTSWSNIECEWDQGSVGASDGRLKIWHNGSLVVSQEAIKWRDYDYSLGMIGFGWYKSYGETNTNYFDDVYLDNSLARVMIGNAASFGDCTHKEIQIPSAWSSTAVTFTVNAGTFGGSDSAYLYVIDSDGNVSDQNGSAQDAQGFPVTFSGTAGSDTTPPNLSGKYPANGATNVSITSGLIYWYLSDASGVSDNSVVCTVEGADVSEFISFSGASTYRRCEIDITSLAAWTNSQEINVTVDADDVNGNSMTQEVWSFTTVAASGGGGGGASSGNSISIGSGTINLGGGRITL